jgi:hypothetical protein
MIDIEKLRGAMRDIAAEKGPFTLFALFRREDNPWGWDLVVSSRWLDEGKLKTLGEFAELLKRAIGEKQIRELSRIATIKENDAALNKILSAIQVDDGMVELRDNSFFGLQVEHAIFLRAKRTAKTPRPNSPDHARRSQKTRPLAQSS